MLASTRTLLRRWPAAGAAGAALTRPAPSMCGLLRPLARARCLCAPASTTVSNPLLDVSVPVPAGEAPAKKLLSDVAAAVAADGEDVLFSHKEKRLPVGPKKLRVVANLAIGLYWREAMAQLEFCRKTIAVHVKNTIAKAVKDAEEVHGLDPTRLVVDQLAVGKGSYLKELDFKAKGRAGIIGKRQAHIHCVLRQVSADRVQSTRYFGRWRQAARLRAMPWEERVQQLPRYQPIPGYEPGDFRVRTPLADERALQKPSRPRATRRRPPRPPSSGGSSSSSSSGGGER